MASSPHSQTHYQPRVLHERRKQSRGIVAIMDTTQLLANLRVFETYSICINLTGQLALNNNTASKKTTDHPKVRSISHAEVLYNAAANYFFNLCVRIQQICVEALFCFYKNHRWKKWHFFVETAMKRELSLHSTAVFTESYYSPGVRPTSTALPRPPRANPRDETQSGRALTLVIVRGDCSATTAARRGVTQRVSRAVCLRGRDGTELPDALAWEQGARDSLVRWSFYRCDNALRNQAIK